MKISYIKGWILLSKQLKADLALLFVTLGWGASFILTKNSLSELPTYNFLAIRFLFAFIITAVFYFKRIKNSDSFTIKYGIILGFLLYGVYAFQTTGLNYTTTSKSAFITGFSVILVPVFTSFINKRLPTVITSVSVLFAFAGLALITLNQEVTGLNIGDFYTGVCAVLFALYIIAVGKYTSKTDSLPFAIIQIGTVGVLSLLTSIVIETPTIPQSLPVWLNVAALSIICTAGAYIVQNVAQKYTSATHTAVIFTGEPVFAAIFAYIFVGETLGTKGAIGAVLIVASMLFIELDVPKMISNRRQRNLKESSN